MVVSSFLMALSFATCFSLLSRVPVAVWRSSMFIPTAPILTRLWTVEATSEGVSPKPLTASTVSGTDRTFAILPTAEKNSCLGIVSPS